MGMWNETCAGSRLPIFGGDPVVFITMESELALADLRNPILPFPASAVSEFGSGEYDCYGRVEGREDVDNHLDPPHLRRLFFHAEVWRAAIAAYDARFPEGRPPLRACDYDDRRLTADEAMEVIKVFSVCRLCRIDITSPVISRGMQAGITAAAVKIKEACDAQFAKSLAEHGIDKYY